MPVKYDYIQLANFNFSCNGHFQVNVKELYLSKNCTLCKI